MGREFPLWLFTQRARDLSRKTESQSPGNMSQAFYLTNKPTNPTKSYSWKIHENIMNQPILI